MARIGFKAEEKEVVEYKDGEYILFIQAVEYKQSKSGKDMLVLTLRGEEGEISDQVRTITCNVVDTYFGRADLFTLFQACGIDTERDDVDTEEIQGNYIGVVIEETDPYNDERRWQARRLFVPEEDEDDDDEDFETSDSDEDDGWD